MKTSLLLLYTSFLLLATQTISTKRRRKDAEETSREEPVEEVKRTLKKEYGANWDTMACTEYDACLSAYDAKTAVCGGTKHKEADDTDVCYIPIANLHDKLIRLKEERNYILRKCYLTGRIVQSKKEKKKKDKEKETVVGKRHQTSCKQKFSELSLFMSTREDGDHSCFVAAKKIRDRCHKIESCCPRVKTCRNLIAKQPIMEAIRELESRLKEQRRACKENE